MRNTAIRSNFWINHYGLDLRSLAAMRIGLAFVILTDLLTRIGDLKAHYTEQGVLPWQAFKEIFPSSYWSFHFISGQPWIQGIIFALAIALTLLFLIGFKTRLVTIACWALTVSLHNRNPALVFAADDVLRAIMFWSMFLPLGARFSVDSALNTAPKPWETKVFGVATVALMIQQCYIYMFSAFFKTTSSAWWPEGSAVYYALSFDQYVTPIGAWLLNFGFLLPLFTFFTLVLEWIGPLFIFMPFRTALFRNIAVITFILLHLGFGITLNIGIFPILSISTWLAFIPSSMWGRWRKQCYGQEHINLTIYYDQDCGFCKKIVHLIKTFLVLPDAVLMPAQGESEIEALMKRYNSWVVKDYTGRKHYRFEAIVYCCRLSPIGRFFAPVLALPLAMSLGNRYYNFIATHRQQAGIFTRPLKFQSFRVKLSKLNHGLSAVLIGLVTLWNLRSITNHYAFIDSPNSTVQALRRVTNSRTANRLNNFMRASRLDQSWSIFSPAPPRDDGWYVIRGTLENGEIVNVMQPDQSLDLEKPTLAERQSFYRNLQWRTYFINLNRSIGEKLYPYFGDYLCQRWNSSHHGNVSLAKVEVTFIDERTVPPGENQVLEEYSTLRKSCKPNSLE